jgi:hypothetical protein
MGAEDRVLILPCHSLSPGLSLSICPILPGLPPFEISPKRQPMIVDCPVRVDTPSGPMCVWKQMLPITVSAAIELTTWSQFKAAVSEGYV